MPVFLDVKPKLDASAAQAAAREATAIFTRAGDDIGRGLSGALSRAMSGVDGSAARRELQAMQAEYTKLSVAQAEAARMAVRSDSEVAIARARLSEVTEKYAADSSKAMKAELLLADAQARSARATKDNADALIATSAAHRKLGDATAAAGGAVSRTSQVINAAGVGSLVGFGAAMAETTRKAADFQQSMIKLQASAGLPVQDLKTASDGILKLAGQVGYSAGALSEGMYTITKAGYSAADGLKVLQAAAQGANAEQAPLSEVVSALTTSLQDFHKPASDASDVMSKMVTAVGASKVPLQDFAGALHTIEPTAAQLHLSLSDVWGVLAQITQSGTSADQAADQLNNAMRALSGAQAPARQAMQQFGINADDVSQKLGTRGLSGTLQYLYDTLAKKIDPSTQLLNTGDLLRSTQSLNDAHQMITQMSPQAQELAKELENNTITRKEYNKAVKGSNEADATQLKQFQALIDKLDGFSKRLTGGRQTLETLNQAINDVTGTMSGAAVTLQTTGDHAQETNDKIKAISQTTAEADGTVKGFNETQETLNAKMRDAEAAFGAAAIEIGAAFVPVMTQVADVAKTVGDEMAKHPGITKAVVDALGVLGGAWLTFKAYNIAATVLAPIATGLEAVAAGESVAAGGAGVLRAALSVIGPAAAGVAIGLPVANAVEHSDWYRNMESHNPLSHNPISEFINRNTPGWLGGDTVDAHGDTTPAPGHASGGPLRAGGPKGRDSALFWGADGEHVLAADDVDALGGHAGVYAFRDALHRAGGGAIGPDVAAAYSMIGTPYNQGSRADCSGMVGRIISEAIGIDVGLPTTQNMGQWLAALGFKPGLGGPGMISVGWYNHGSAPNDGHAAMTLSDGENAESGGSHGNFIVGAGAAGAGSSEFDHHMFLPTLFGEGAATGGGGGGGVGYGGGGGVPAGSTAGTGPGGQRGYYTPDQAKISAADDRYADAQNRLAVAKEREAEVDKDPDAKQSTKDRAHNQVIEAQHSLARAQEAQAKAHQGAFHALKDGAGGMGGGGGLGGFGAPLPDNFGLGQGLPGLAQWLVTFLGDMALAPAEGALLGGLSQLTGIPPSSGGGGLIGTLSALAGGGGGSDLGDIGSAQLPYTLGGGGGMPQLGGGGPFPTGTGSGLGSLGGVGTDTGIGTGAPPSPSGTIPGMSAVPPSAPASAPSTPAAAPTSVNYKDWYGNPATNFYLDWYPGGAGAPLPTRSPSALGPPSGAPQWPPHGIPTPLPGPFRTPAQQRQDMLGGAGSGGPPPSAARSPNPVGPFTSGDPRWGAPLPGLLQGQHFATGGPAGTDTIPAWLSPDEFVESSSAVHKYGMGIFNALNSGSIDSNSVRYFGGGGGTGDTPPAPPPPPPKPPPPPAPDDTTGTSGGPVMRPPGAPEGGPVTSVPGGKSADDGRQNLSQPGRNMQLYGAGTSNPGFGLTGSGLIGFAMSAPLAVATAAGAGAGSPGPAAGAGSVAGAGLAAAQMAVQNIAIPLANRAIGFAGQAAGIATEGVLETILPADSPLSNFSNTLPGKLIAGIAGAKPNLSNTAGKTQAPMKSGGQGQGDDDSAAGGGSGTNFTIHGDMNVHPRDLGDFVNQVSAQTAQSQQYAAQAAIPTNRP